MTTGLTLKVRNAVGSKDRAEVYIGRNTLDIELAAPAEPVTITALTLALTRFGGLESKATITAVDANGWRALPSGANAWSLTCGDPRPQKTLSFRVSDVQAAGPAGGLAHVLASYRLQDGTTRQAAADVLVERRTPDSRKDAATFAGELAWLGAAGDAVVYISADGIDPIDNTLVCELRNPRPLTSADPTPLSSFFLSFVLAGDGKDPGATARALTTHASAFGSEGAHAPITVENDAGWEMALPVNDPEAPAIWKFTPARPLGPNESVCFRIRNVRVPGSFEPGHTTFLLLQYGHSPENADGFFSLPIRKERPPATLRHFTPAAAVVDPGEPVVFAWETENASRVELSFVTAGTPHLLKVPRSTSSYPAKPLPEEQWTEYTLSVYDSTDACVVQERRTIEQRLPRITRFETAGIPVAGQLMELRWTVEQAERCTVSDSVGVKRDTPVAPDASRCGFAAPESPIDFTLTAIRNTKATSRTLTVYVQSHLPPRVPFPGFLFDTAFRLVTSLDSERNELWRGQFATKSGTPARLDAGQLDADGQSITSANQTVETYLDRWCDSQAPFFSYLAVRSANADDPPPTIEVYGSSEAFAYRGWSGYTWMDAPARFGQYYWWRSDLKPFNQWPVEVRISVRSAVPNSRFTLWAYSWNR